MRLAIILFMLTILMTRTAAPIAAENCSWKQQNNVKSGLQSDIQADKQHYEWDAPILLQWTLTNVGAETIAVVSHYEVSSDPCRHFDPVTIEWKNERSGEKGFIPLTTARRGVARMCVEMVEGQKVSHSIKVNTWLKISRAELGHGKITMKLKYHVPVAEPSYLSKANDTAVHIKGVNVHEIWKGVVFSNPISVFIRKK